MDDIKAPSPTELFKGKKKAASPQKKPSTKRHVEPKEDTTTDFEGAIKELLSQGETHNRGAQLKGAYDEGFRKGRQAGRADLVDFLEARYNSKRGPERGTPEAKALLELAAQAGRFLRGEPVQGPLGDHR